MTERYPGNVVEDEHGNVCHPHDLGIETDDAIYASFNQLPVGEQDWIIGTIDDLPHHAAPVEHDIAHSAGSESEALREPTMSDLLEHTPPLTAQELAAAYRRRNVARQAIYSASDDRERPYDELGGRLSHEHTPTADELLELIVTNTEDWMRDVHDMLRYAIPELTTDAIGKMTKKDQELLALHFQGLWDRIPASQRVIAADNKDHDFLVRRYGKWRTMEELTDYIERLDNLNKYLERNQAAWTLRQIAYGGFHSKARRNAKYLYDREHAGDIYVVVDKKGKKYRVKRVTGQ